MKRRLPFIIIFSLLCAEFAFSGSLFWVERKSDHDRDLLISSGIPLIEEFSSGFLAEGSTDMVQPALDKLGFRSQLLDRDAERSSYAVVAFRNGKVQAAEASTCGDVLWSQENWALLRIQQEAPAPCMRNTGWFLRLLPRKQLKPSAAPPAEYGGQEPQQAFTAKPLVQEMVASLSDTRIQLHWNDVVTTTTTRHSTSAGCLTAAQAVFDKLQAYHLDPVFQNHTPGHAPNIIGVTAGVVDPGAVYIVIGHLDDLPSSGLAPGADDNASGSALVTMLGEVMSCYAFANTVKFIAVTGEEFGLYGSTYYADDALARGENIQGVLNADMIGWEGNGTPAPENLDLNYNAASQWLGELFAQCAQEYGTGCVVDAFSCPSLTASDHAPFWANGWSAVCGITDNEGYCGHNGNYPYYHTSNDTVAHCGNPSFYYKAARAYIATLAHMADPFKIRFDRDQVACSSTIQLTVGDRDLNANPSVQETATVLAWSTTEPAPETILLTEQGSDSMIFTGLVTTTSAPPVSGDGMVSVTGTDTVTAQYTDAVACNGTLNAAYTDTATADCAPPSISNVAVADIKTDRATVTWNTNEASNSRTTHAVAPGPPGINTDDPANYVTNHSVTITGLDGCTDYVFSATSADAVGNSSTDTNGGLFYNFTTPGLGYFLSDDVESGGGDWIAGGTGTSDFHIDTCKSNSPAHAWKAGSASCPGAYGSSALTTLTSAAAFNIEYGSELHYAEFYKTQSAADLCKVQISTNGGSTWTTLDTYSGDSGGWLQKGYDLSAYAGSTSRIRFQFSSNANTNMEGWYLDDIRVTRLISCVAVLANKRAVAGDSCPLGGAGDGDGILDPGESATLQVTVQNLGSVEATGITGHLSTSTPGVAISDADATFPDIPSGGTGLSMSPHFTIDAAASVPCGTTIQFHMNLATDQGLFAYDFTMPVGAPTTTTGTYNPTDVPRPIPDPGSTASTISVGDTRPVTDVNVRVNILHPSDADLDLFLQAPGGSPSIELSTDNGGSGANYSNTVFDDQALNSIVSGSAPFTGTFSPEGQLSNVNGLAANGGWALSVTDDAAGSSGTLLSWSLTITTSAGSVCTVCANCPAITLSPAALPDGNLGSFYNQAITASGGTGPYTFVLASGSLPPGLALSSSGALTGTPASPGTYNFTVTATDQTGCAGSQAYAVTVGACLFCDDFEDGVLSGSWNYVQPSWSETNGTLTGIPAGKKAIAVASPVFGGCSQCYVEATLQTAGGPGNKVSLLGWYLDSKNSVELLMKQESGKWLLKERVGGSIVGKRKASMPINSNQLYRARITFTGTQFDVTIDGVPVLTLSTAGAHNGTVAFQVKATTGTFGEVVVN